MAARIPSRHREKPPHTTQISQTNPTRAKMRQSGEQLAKGRLAQGEVKRGQLAGGGRRLRFEGVSVGGRYLIPTRREEAKNHLSKK